MTLEVFGDGNCDFRGILTITKLSLSVANSTVKVGMCSYA